jgi:hypothetical protein
MSEGTGTPPTEDPAPPAETTPEGASADATPAAASPQTPPTEAAPTPTAPVPELQKSLDARKADLDAALARFGAEGWRIENRSEFQATIAKGHRINHVLHLLLTILTLGFWAIVWIFLAIFGGEKRQLVTVDDFGNVVATKV